MHRGGLNLLKASCKKQNLLQSGCKAKHETWRHFSPLRVVCNTATAAHRYCNTTHHAHNHRKAMGCYKDKCTNQR